MLLALATMTLALTASAAPVIFTFGDHPDAGISGTRQTPYGIILDDLDDPYNQGYGPTFSVGPNLGGSGGPLTLVYDPMNLAAGATIAGFAYRNDIGVVYSVNYFLTGLTAIGGDALANGFTATAANGTLSSPNQTIALVGKADSTGSVFTFNNIGWRLPGDPGVGWVGEGWLDPTYFSKSMFGYNDFLMTAIPGPPPGNEPVPEPGTISLMLIGIGMLVGGRKLRRRG